MFGFPIPGLEDDERDLYESILSTAQKPDEPLNVVDGLSSFSLPPVSQPNPFASQELPAASYMNPQRTARLYEIDAAMNALQKVQTERALAAQTTPNMTGDQAFATTIVSALPLILGRIFAGNSGGALGGAIGAGIAKGATEGYDKKNEEAQARAKAEYDLGKGELSDLQQQKRALQTQGYAAEDALRLEGTRQGNREEMFEKNQSAINDRLNRAAGIRNEGLNLREKGILGSESNRLAAKFQGNPFVKSAVNSINAANNIDTLMANPSSVTAGQVATQLAVLAGESGMKTEGDIRRNLGDTFAKRYAEFQNFATNSADSPLPPAQVAAIKELTSAMRPLAEKKIAAVRSEISGLRLAPLTEEKGLLDDIIMHLGSAADSMNQTPGAKPTPRDGDRGERDGVTYERQNGKWVPVK